MITLLRYLHIIHKSIIKNIGYILQQASISKGVEREKSYGVINTQLCICLYWESVIRYRYLWVIDKKIGSICWHQSARGRSIPVDQSILFIQPNEGMNVDGKNLRKHIETFADALQIRAMNPCCSQLFSRFFLLHRWWYQIDVVFHPWISTCSNGTRKRSIIRRFLRKFFFCKAQ